MSRKDYRLEVRVRNNNILKAIEDVGYDSIPEFCRDQNVSYGSLLNLIAMRESPLLKDGQISSLVIKLMGLLERTFDELFNEVQVETIANNRTTAEVSAEELYAMIPEATTLTLLPEDHIAHVDLKNAISEVLDKLTPREREVIILSYGLHGNIEHSDEEIGRRYYLTRGRIGQIRAKALRKLRHPSRTDILLPLLEEDEREEIEENRRIWDLRREEHRRQFAAYATTSKT